MHLQIGLAQWQHLLAVEGTAALAVSMTDFLRDTSPKNEKLCNYIFFWMSLAQVKELWDVTTEGHIVQNHKTLKFVCLDSAVRIHSLCLELLCCEEVCKMCYSVQGSKDLFALATLYYKSWSLSPVSLKAKWNPKCFIEVIIYTGIKLLTKWNF